MDAYRKTNCSNVADRLAYRELKDQAEAEKFYQRKVELDIFSRPEAEFYGEKDGFSKDEGFLLRLGDWRVLIDSEGKDVNLLEGLEVLGMARTYVRELSDFVPILLLNDFRVDNNYAQMEITLDPQKAKYILLMEPGYSERQEKIPKLPWRIKQDSRLLFNATRVIKTTAMRTYYMRYYVYAYAYPYEHADLEPIITSYRNQLYEQYLEGGFKLVDENAAEDDGGK